MKTLIYSIPVVLLLASCGGNTPSASDAAGKADGLTTQSPSSAKAPDESAALDAITKINEGQATYFKLNRRYALTLDELVEAHLLKEAPSAQQTGYDFTLRPAADAQTYRLIVNPVGSAASARHFFTDQSGTVHAEAGKDATADSPSLRPS